MTDSSSSAPRQELHDLGRQLMQEHYAHLPVERLKLVQGDPVHTLWRVTTQIGDVCLKRSSASPPTLEFTTAAHEYLFRNGARVPELLPTAQGARFFVHQGLGIALYGWIQGSPLVMDDARPHLRAAVEELGHFHGASLGFQPPPGVPPISTLGQLPARMRGALREIRRWLEGERGGEGFNGGWLGRPREFREAFLEAAPAMVEQGKEALDRLDASPYREWVAEVAAGGGMLVHGEFRKGNALVVEEGVCVLDLEHLSYGLPVADLRGVILAWMETQGRWSDEDLGDILAWYGKSLPLTPDQRQVLFADLLFPHGFVKAVHHAEGCGDELDLPDLQRIAGLETERRRHLNREETLTP